MESVIKAIFSDVDGTLLNGDRQLSARTIQAFRRLRERVLVVLASSRMPAAMRHLQVELGIENHPLICYNGGYVLASGMDQTTYANHVISWDVCSGIVAQAAGLPIHVSLYHADHWYARTRDRWTDKEERVTKASAEFLALEEVLANWKREHLGAHKIMCMGEAQDMAAFYEWLNAQYGEHIHIYKSRPTYLELATREVTKATGMELIMQMHLSSSNQSAMAFGDNYNDVDMLMRAGIGIAVSNAVPEAKAVATEVTDAGKEDGVARALERHFNLPSPS